MGNRPSWKQNPNYRQDQQPRRRPQKRVPREANRPIVEFPDDDEDENIGLEKDKNSATFASNQKENEYFSRKSEEEPRYRDENPLNRPIRKENGLNSFQVYQKDQMRYDRANDNEWKHKAEYPSYNQSRNVRPIPYSRKYYQDDIANHDYSLDKPNSQKNLIRGNIKERHSREKPTQKPNWQVLGRKDFNESLHRNRTGTEYDPKDRRPKNSYSNHPNKSEDYKPDNRSNKNNSNVKPGYSDNVRSEDLHDRKQSGADKAAHLHKKDREMEIEPTNTRSRNFKPKANTNDTQEELNPWINSHLWEI